MATRQLSIFDGTQNLIIDLPVRLITLFSGYDSQALALKYLEIPFEHYKTCEWAIHSIQALKDLHFENDSTDYSLKMSFDEVVNYLYQKGISSNYNTPMTLQSIRRKGEKECRRIYNNICATHNLVNIQQVHGFDLEITDTKKYCYIMTYSFPCQDLSNAGLGAGMAKGSGTRSGMLWEVERILRELNGEGKWQLPQVLLMENVPKVHGQNNIKHFAEWVAFLESIGYKCYWEDLNAKDYGIPQNRNRCFMVSVLGDYLYEFPQPIPLEHFLADCLEQEVDEKYYLSDAIIDTYLEYNRRNEEKGNGFKFNPGGGQFNSQSNTDEGRKPSVRQLCGAIISQQGRKVERLTDTATTLMARDYKGFGNQGQTGVLVCKKDEVMENDVIRHSYTHSRMIGQMRDIQQNNMSPTIDTRADCLGVVKNYRIRKLTPKECFTLQGVKMQDIKLLQKNQSNSSQYHLAGDSICCSVLIAIFAKMFGKDSVVAVKKYLEQIFKIEK